MLRGRGIQGSDGQASQRVVVVSRSAAESYWPGEDPIGREILVGHEAAPRTVVGIAADVRSVSLTQEPSPEIYVPHTQTDRRVMAFLVRSEGPAAPVLAAARDIVHAVDPRLPLIQPRTMEDVEREALARSRFHLLLVALFAVLAVVLVACLIPALRASRIAPVEALRGRLADLTPTSLPAPDLAARHPR